MSDGFNILPDSRTRTIHTPRGAVNCGVVGYRVPIFCANCGKHGGWVNEENMTFAYWQCDPCFAKYGELTKTFVMPDEVFWKRVEQEQIEKYGRALTSEEMIVKLADPESLESKLARDRSILTPQAGD